MTEDEIADLLTIAATFDRRTIGVGDVHAWFDSARRGRWTFDEASEAVKDYYARTTAERPWIMPSHITHMIRADREIRHMRAKTRELVQPPPRMAQAIAATAHATVIPAQEPREPKQPALRVGCPHCHAQRGESCTRPRPTGRPIPTKPHPSRVEAAKHHTDSQ